MPTNNSRKTTARIKCVDSRYLRPLPLVYNFYASENGDNYERLLMLINKINCYKMDVFGIPVLQLCFDLHY